MQPGQYYGKQKMNSCYFKKDISQILQPSRSFTEHVVNSHLYFSPFNWLVLLYQASYTMDGRSGK